MRLITLPSLFPRAVPGNPDFARDIELLYRQPVRALTLRPLDRPIGTLQLQVPSDERLVNMWLHGRPAHTRRAYKADAARFLIFAGSLRSCTLGHVQAFADAL